MINLFNLGIKAVVYIIIKHKKQNHSQLIKAKISKPLPISIEAIMKPCATSLIIYEKGQFLQIPCYS